MTCAVMGEILLNAHHDAQGVYLEPVYITDGQREHRT